MIDTPNNSPSSPNIIANRYKIIRELGSGGFGVTYLVEDLGKSSQSLYVAKQLKLKNYTVARWTKAKERFIRESKILALLGEHEQIPTLVNYLQDNQELYLIQELIDGEDLETEICNNIWTEKEVIKFLQEVLLVLKFVHEKKVIHRDLKPSNLIRRKSDQKIFLIDFGAVKEISTILLEEYGEDKYTQIIGTPGYIAPEQQKGQPIFSSDIYSLGKIALYAITGKQPYQIEDTKEELNKTLQLKTRNNQIISAGLVKIISKMIAGNISERYYSVDEVINDLKPLDLIGQIFNYKYQLIQYLGKGSYGATYIAKFIDNDKKKSEVNIQSLVVVKILKLPKNPQIFLAEYRDIIIEEIITLKKIGTNAHIPEIFDFFHDDKNIYLVEEFIDGFSLEEQLIQQPYFSEQSALKLLLDVLPILNYLHEQGFIHKHISPNNIIRRRSDYKTVLTDAGKIKDILLTYNQMYLNNSTNFMKNDPYLSPEQINSEPNFSSDIYSLGLTTIRALTGSNPANLMKDPQTGEILWQTETKINQKLKDILSKMVYFDDKQRYQQAKDVLNELQQKKKNPQKSFIYNLLFISNYRYILVFILTLFLFVIGITISKINQSYFLFQQGDLKQESGEYLSAISYYEKGLNNVPPWGNILVNRQRVLLQKASAYSSLKDYKSMLNVCEEIILIYSDNVLGLICKGTALELLNENQAAIETYEKAKTIDSSVFEIWHNLGNVYIKNDQKDLAIEHFIKAIEVGEGKNHVSWNDLAKLYYERGKYDLAMNAYKEAIASKSDYTVAWIGVGNLYIFLKEFDNALEAYNQALSHQTTNIEALYGKALAYEGLQEYEKALDFYDKTFLLNPNFTLAFEGRKRVLKKMNSE